MSNRKIGEALEPSYKEIFFGIREYWEEKCFYFFSYESVNACLSGMSTFGFLKSVSSKRFCVGNCCATKAASRARLRSLGARQLLLPLGSQ
jgi:hypothetical protein